MQKTVAARVMLVCFLAATPAASLAVGTSAGSTPSMNAPQFDAAAEYRKGVEALKGNQFGAAKSSFARVLGVAPNDANTNFLAGMADAGLNDLKAAAKHYEHAVRADGKMVVAQQELGVTYAKLGDRPKAEATLGKLKNMDASCGGSCKDSDLLKKAISTIEAALGQPGQALLTTSPSLLFASAKAGDSAYLQAVSLINEKRYVEAIAPAPPLARIPTFSPTSASPTASCIITMSPKAITAPHSRLRRTTKARPNIMAR